MFLLGKQFNFVEGLEDGSVNKVLDMHQWRHSFASSRTICIWILSTVVEVSWSTSLAEMGSSMFTEWENLSRTYAKEQEKLAWVSSVFHKAHIDMCTSTKYEYSAHPQTHKHNLWLIAYFRRDKGGVRLKEVPCGN